MHISKVKLKPYEIRRYRPVPPFGGTLFSICLTRKEAKRIATLFAEREQCQVGIFRNRSPLWKGTYWNFSDGLKRKLKAKQVKAAWRSSDVGFCFGNGGCVGPLLEKVGKPEKKVVTVENQESNVVVGRKQKKKERSGNSISSFRGEEKKVAVKGKKGIRVVCYPKRTTPGRPRKVPRVKWQVTFRGGDLTNGTEKVRFLEFYEKEVKLYALMEEKRRGKGCVAQVERVKRRKGV